MDCRTVEFKGIKYALNTEQKREAKMHDINITRIELVIYYLNGTTKSFKEALRLAKRFLGET